MNFAKAVNLAMRNGFAKFAKWVVNFAMRNFAKVETTEQCIGIAKSKLALRIWNWHCEIEFGIAKLALRNFRIAKLVCELIANFGNAKFCIGFVRGKFRKVQCTGLLDFAMRNWLPTHCEIRNGCELFANSLRKSSFADFPCFLSCLQLHLILFTFPLIFH